MAYVGLPPGSLTQYAGSSVPNGWLVCDGTAVSRTTYADLFSAVGTTYGVGDGTTTFNLPDMRGRMAVGLGTNTAVNTLGKNDGVTAANRRPQHQHSPHTHNVTDPGHTHAQTWTSTMGYNPYASGTNIQATNNGGSTPGLILANATTGISIAGASSGSGNANDAMDSPAYLVTQYIIKY